MLLILLFLSFINGIPLYSFNKLPTVLMHGILSNANNMNQLKNYLINEFNINVIVPEIGNGIYNSINLPLETQGKMLCMQLNTYEELSNGFNFIGISQGGILGRYYIEKCNGYKVNNFITIVTPHGGVYKPGIGKFINLYNEYARNLSFSSYWRDPYNYEIYKSTTLLADLNNEINLTESSNNMKNFLSIQNFIMVYSENDDIITPPESGKFSMYQVNTLNILSLELIPSFKTLGLDILKYQNKLHIYKTNCTHEEHKEYFCFIHLYNMFQKYLI